MAALAILLEEFFHYLFVSSQIEDGANAQKEDCCIGAQQEDCAVVPMSKKDGLPKIPNKMKQQELLAFVL
jgi:hypothetical protein